MLTTSILLTRNFHFSFLPVSWEALKPQWWKNSPKLATAALETQQRLLRRLLAWLSNLKWYPSGKVTCIELVVDLESFMANSPNSRDLRLIGPDAPLPARARILRQLIKKLNTCCQKLGLPQAFPVPPNRNSSLRTLGGPNHLIGYDCRPNFTSGRLTENILELQVAKARPVKSGWASDITPIYSIMREKATGEWEVSYRTR